MTNTSSKAHDSTKFSKDLTLIYAKSQEMSKKIYEFFDALQPNATAKSCLSTSHTKINLYSESSLRLDTSLLEKRTLLYALAKKCKLGLESSLDSKLDSDLDTSPHSYPNIEGLEGIDTPQLLAIAERIVNLREDRLIQQLTHHTSESSTSPTQKQRIKAARAYMLEFVGRFYQKRQEEILEFIEQNKLLDEFYREVIRAAHRVGLAMNAFFKVWQEQLIDGINEDLSRYSFNEALELVKESLERDESGQIAGRCYSIPLWQSKTSAQNLNQFQNLDQTLKQELGQYVSLPYAMAFPNEVEGIINALHVSIEALSTQEDYIFSRKSAYIAYFKALILAWSEKDSTKLIARWQEVDRAWLGIDTPLQIAHPFEYYEDIYRHSVAPEWDLRLSNPNALPSYAKAHVSAMFEVLASLLGASDELCKCVRASMSQSSLYNSLPLLFYGAEHNGLFSAQVVPNDEMISNLLGKKIFAFPDRIIAQARAKPRLKINAEFFEEVFLNRAREVLMEHEGLWHYVYDISTNGHEFGHILWVDKESEGIMNDGEFKNIEEFKATCGGLVAWIMHYEGDLDSKTSESRALYDEMIHYEESLGGKEVILEALMSDAIRRAVGLIAWRESVEVRPYYCEGLIHLCGMFESGVLEFNKEAKPKLKIKIEHFNALCEWYKHTYASLAQHYMAKAKARAWLGQFVDCKRYLPHNEVVREFVEHYWERYLAIGGEILGD